MKLLSALASVAFVTPCLSATITLYDIITTELPLPSETFTAIGTDSDGATTYSNQVVQSVYVVPVRTSGLAGPSTSWSTLTTDPVTLHETMVADASHFSILYLNPSASIDIEVSEESLDCELDGKGGGDCVLEVLLGPSGTSARTVNFTYSGSALPIYTLTTTNGAAPLVVAKAWGLAALGVITGGLLVL